MIGLFPSFSDQCPCLQNERVLIHYLPWNLFTQQRTWAYQNNFLCFMLTLLCPWLLKKNAKNSFLACENAKVLFECLTFYVYFKIFCYCNLNRWPWSWFSGTYDPIKIKCPESPLTTPWLCLTETASYVLKKIKEKSQDIFYTSNYFWDFPKAPEQSQRFIFYLTKKATLEIILFAACAIYLWK